jgi:bifunctional DNA-binding transcriptional regulator/antitoxin component of YhaV-PrlF toxin-antitoxin module
MAAIHDRNIHHMRVTSAGQVSIPAAVRKRWATSRVRIVDEGDRLVVEPEPENPFARFTGIFAGPGPTADEMGAEDRRVEQEAEDRRFGGSGR